MPADEDVCAIRHVLRTCIRNKFCNYRPEPAIMPFHARLPGQDRLALYQFIHSLNTSFGTSIFEPVAVVMARQKFRQVQCGMKLGGSISTKAQSRIQEIMDALATVARTPDKKREVELIREVAQMEPMTETKPTKVDIALVSEDNTMYLFDLKTAKPNKGGFKEFKRTLLEWVAVSLAKDPNRKIVTGVAIPYNPYAPKKYERWTISGMLDLEHELKVAEELWDFLGGENAYAILLDCFERVGIELRDEIDAYFAKFRNP